jgi:hypothetical protein
MSPRLSSIGGWRNSAEPGPVAEDQGVVEKGNRKKNSAQLDNWAFLGNNEIVMPV